MKPILLSLLLVPILLATKADAHDWKFDGDPGNREALRQHILDEWLMTQQLKEKRDVRPVQLASSATWTGMAATLAASEKAPAQSLPFQLFPKLELKWDEDFLYVGSNGLPAHNMMVGITAWQQQVPLPQAYFGDNAWRIPLHPVPAKTPAKIEGNFLRGAIALAVNGVPIFNPQNNRGEVSYEIGELDEWGGHCGRADDYHYHIAPLHLEAVVGEGKPVAYALDGYPIYGLTEPDGSPLRPLDQCHGHDDPEIGYHYHASTGRPYLQSAFYGEVTEAGGQIDPQPRAQGVRPDSPPLRGAVITGFEKPGENSYQLSYEIGSEKRSVSYKINDDGTYPFEYDNGRDGITKEVYTRRGGGGGGGPGGKGDGKGKGEKGKGIRPEETPRTPRPDAFTPPRTGEARSDSSSFVLTSPEVEDGGKLPADYTGDGSGATLPLAWNGAPAGTKSYALIMDHLAPGNEMKGYWTMWGIPAEVTSLPKNASGIGKLGTGFRGRVGYEAPNSQGPGEKTYALHLYALSAEPAIDLPASDVNREVLLAAIQGLVLAQADLSVVYSRDAAGDSPKGGERPSEEKGGPGGKGGSKGTGKGPDQGGLIKPSLDDTMRLNVYADNWFMLYVNGRLVAVDPIPFTPHNVVSVDFLPEYPMTIAVLAKDNADPQTGLEYGTNIGDGGLILKFGDGTVTNATWKAKPFFHGPIKADTANPQVKHEPLPENWWLIDFDDSDWEKAKEYSVAEVNPKQPYYDSDFEGATFIWTSDLALDNTVLFRTRIEKPGWTPRWNTKPDLDTTGAPLR